MDCSPVAAFSDASPSSRVIEEDLCRGGLEEDGSVGSVGSETDNNSHVDVDGPEVLPCSASSSSSSSSQSDVDVCSDETPPSVLTANGIADKCDIGERVDGQEETASASAAAGGRLRFFLAVNSGNEWLSPATSGHGHFVNDDEAGRCVLELAHDTDGDGKPKQWTQTSSKSYYPRPATWIPSTIVRERRERKISPCSGTTESSSLQRKKPCYNGSYFPFAMLRHSSSSHFSRDFQISRVCLRRAARSPLRTIAMKSPGAGSDFKTVSSVTIDRNIRKRFTFTQRAERLFRVIESLPRCISVSPVEDIVSGEGVGCGSLGNFKVGAVKLQSDASSGCQAVEQFHKGKGSKVESCTMNAFRIPSKESSFSPNKIEQVTTHSKKWPLSDTVSTVPQLDDTPPNTPKKLKKDVCNSSVIPDESSGGRWSIPRLVSPSVEPNDQRFLSPTITIEPPRTSQPCAASNPVVNCISPCSVLPVETTSLNRGVQKKRKRGAYGRGRTIGEAVRNFVIREILDLGGDLRTKCVPRGVFTEVGLRYKVDATTTYRWWLKYCNSLRSGDAPSVAGVESSQYVGHKANASETPRRSVVKTVASNSRVHGLTSSMVENSVSLRSCNRDLSGKYQMTSLSSKRKERNVLYSTDVPFRDTCAADSHSPQSNDSQSSSTSIVDPASLYASFVHANVWPQHLPLPPPPPSPHPIAIANGARSLSARLPPLPVGICFPYVWNQPQASSSSSANRLQGCPTSPFNEKGESESVDEPLDLTLPKKCAKRDDLVNGVTRNQSTVCYGLNDLHRSNRTTIQSEQRGSIPNSYSEWRLDPSVLKTNYCDDRHREKERSLLLPSTSSQSRHLSPKSFHETSSSHSSLHSLLHPQRNMKPKHYPFLSLQIGTFEVHSKMSEEGDVPNKFKVIFTKRKFVYEFETMVDERREEASGSRQMACIVVPFSIVEAFWCCDTTIVFRVVSKPSMFVGHRQKQAGCVPSLTVYETKRSVDLTGGQLAVAHLHKVTLMKPHLVERLKIYLVLFDVQFRNVATTADSILPVHDLKEADVTE